MKFIPSHVSFIVNYNSENCIKVRKFFTKLQTKKVGSVFYGSRCSMTTCISQHPQFRTADFVGGQFDCPHALNDSNYQHTRIQEKMLEFFSKLTPAWSPGCLLHMQIFTTQSCFLMFLLISRNCNTKKLQQLQNSCFSINFILMLDCVRQGSKRSDKIGNAQVGLMNG